jgi:hypothetical protein
LHRVGIEPRRLNEYEQLIAREPPIREYIEMHVSIRATVRGLRRRRVLRQRERRQGGKTGEAEFASVHHRHTILLK